VQVVHICVSDIHLGYDACHTKQFERFLWEIHRINRKRVDKPSPIKSLMLLGDIFDFWRKDSIDILVEDWKVVSLLLSIPTQILFIAGNHD